MATTDQTDLASRLRFALARSARRLRQEAGADLSPTLLAALSSVERHGPLTPSELAMRERVQRPTATKLIAKLETAGLVARTPDAADRRSCSIAITAAGTGLLETMRTRKDAYLAERLQTLPAEDCETLARAADILEELFEQP